MSYEEWKTRAKDLGVSLLEPKQVIPKEPALISICGECGAEVYEDGFSCQSQDKVKCPLTDVTQKV